MHGSLASALRRCRAGCRGFKRAASRTACPGSPRTLASQGATGRVLHKSAVPRPERRTVGSRRQPPPLRCARAGSTALRAAPFRRGRGCPPVARSTVDARPECSDTRGSRAAWPCSQRSWRTAPYTGPLSGYPAFRVPWRCANCTPYTTLNRRWQSPPDRISKPGLAIAPAWPACPTDPS